MNDTCGALFLGLDLSTQQLKAVVIDDTNSVVYTCAVNFEKELSEYETKNGIHIHDDGLTVTSPVLMWVAAIDKLVDKLKTGIDVKRIRGISGCGQQHGTVYWSRGTSQLLQNLSKNQLNLCEQLKTAFTILDSPIWMDSSTTEQCSHLEDHIGSAEKLAELTGSRAFHRFSGAQIAKIYHQKPQVYKLTERISLVSSFIASIFIGDYAPIDFADGSGMNALNIHNRNWDNACLSGIVGPENIDDLRIKLGSPVQSSDILGKLSPYFVDKYGFRAECEVVAFTGDNPASLAGLGVSDGDIAISCGTSDTLFLWLNRPQPNLEGSIFVNPIASEAFMGMLCFKNGSLTRDRIRKAVNTETWDAFSRLVATTPPGNNGSIGFYFDHPEIVPDVAAGDFRFDSSDREVDSFPPNVEARAMIEHQSLAKRLHAEFLGFKSAEKDSRVLVTGGASTNACILQVLADVFNAPVFIQDIADSAALGGAFRARHGTKMSDRSFHESIAGAVQLKMAATPDPESAKIYDEMVKRYKLLEDQIVGRSKKT